MQASKILSQKTVFQSKYFHVDQITVERNGKTFRKDVIKRNSVVVVLPVTQSNEIYLISEFRDVFQKFILEAVAGHMDANEEPLEAAKRELKEETGLHANKWKKLATIHLSANML